MDPQEALDLLRDEMASLFNAIHRIKQHRGANPADITDAIALTESAHYRFGALDVWLTRGYSLPAEWAMDRCPRWQHIERGVPR